MKYLGIFFLVVFFFIILQVYNDSLNKGIVAQYYDFIEKNKIYEACLLIDKVLDDFKGTKEGASQFEYDRLIESAISGGEHDWVRIFTDRNISITIKQSIVGRVHYYATIDTVQRKSYPQLSDIIKQYKSYIDNNELYTACLLIDQVLKEINETGSQQTTYNKLINDVASYGEHDWIDIFKDPRISLKLKLRIIKKIHGT